VAQDSLQDQDGDDDFERFEKEEEDHVRVTEEALDKRSDPFDKSLDLGSNSSEQEMSPAVREFLSLSSKKLVEVAVTPSSVVTKKEEISPFVESAPEQGEYLPEMKSEPPPLAETPTTKESLSLQAITNSHPTPTRHEAITALTPSPSIQSPLVLAPPPAHTPALVSSSSTGPTAGDSSVKNRASLFSFMPRKNPAYAEPIEGSLTFFGDELFD
jgi:hypothetical protein